ncbi:MAG: hypothetical protein JRH20_10475, partial [Deltaproteobacteria bacterium]|nr:hypothetical protein [Deltaproteobacteria bacterium]
QAWRLGVVNEVSEDLDAVIARWEAALVASGPAAVSAVKELFARAPLLTPDEQRVFTTELIATLRASDEGQEGMRAFLERRDPSWQCAKEEEG